MEYTPEQIDQMLKDVDRLSKETIYFKTPENAKTLLKYLENTGQEFNFDNAKAAVMILEAGGYFNLSKGSKTDREEYPEQYA